jgi:hypothetical protein
VCLVEGEAAGLLAMVRADKVKEKRNWEVSRALCLWLGSTELCAPVC